MNSLVMRRQAKTPRLNPISNMANSIISSSRSMDNTSHTNHIKLTRRMLNMANMRSINNNSSTRTRNTNHNLSTINTSTQLLCRRRSILLLQPQHQPSNNPLLLKLLLSLSLAVERDQRLDTKLRNSPTNRLTRNHTHPLRPRHPPRQRRQPQQFRPPCLVLLLLHRRLCLLHQSPSRLLFQHRLPVRMAQIHPPSRRQLKRVVRILPGLRLRN